MYRSFQRVWLGPQIEYPESSGMTDVLFDSPSGSGSPISEIVLLGAQLMQVGKTKSQQFHKFPSPLASPLKKSIV